jgi:hypothetical protein
VSYPNGRCGEQSLVQISRYYEVTDLPAGPVNSVSDLLREIRRSGLSPAIRPASLKGLKDSIEQGDPVILILVPNSSRGRLHCVVASGLIPLKFQILVHDGEPNQILTISEFKKKCSTMISVTVPVP